MYVVVHYCKQALHACSSKPSKFPGRVLNDPRPHLPHEKRPSDLHRFRWKKLGMATGSHRTDGLIVPAPTDRPPVLPCLWQVVTFGLVGTEGPGQRSPNVSRTRLRGDEMPALPFD